MRIPEDAELPEWREDEEGFEDTAKHNREYNNRMMAIPTSIQSNTDYFVARGEKPGEVRIITEHTRVDQGYKTPKITLPDLGDDEKNKQQIAVFLSQRFTSLRDRTQE